jgi:hypothetical protein
VRMTELMDPIGHAIFERIVRIVESARAPGERSVWTATIPFDPLVDREIVQLELQSAGGLAPGQALHRAVCAQLEKARRPTCAEDGQ